MNRIARGLFSLVVVLAVCVVTVVPVIAGGGTDWQQFHKDAANTGNTTSTVSNNNTILWFTDHIGAVDSSSVVVSDNYVFVYCNNNVKCLNESTGVVEWTSDNLSAPTWSSWSSLAYHNGNVFIASGTKVYSIISDNGTLNWTYTMPSEACNGSVTIAEGRVFVGDWAGHHYYCLDEANGTKQWEFVVDGYAQGTPAYDEGKVYLTSWVWFGNGHVYCVSTDNGAEVWHQTFPLAIAGSAAVSDNVVYVAEYNFGGIGKLYALNTDNGSILWESIAIQSTDGTPAVADGKVYVCGGCPGYWDLATYCFYTDNGTQVWKRDNIGGWTCSMAVADGAVLVGKVKDPWTGGSYGTYALSPDTGETIWSSSYGGSSPAIANGKVFTIAQGRVYAFGTPAALLPDLVPAQMELPTYIDDGVSTNITAVVRNNGAGTATSVKVTLKANSTVIDTQTITSLGASANTTVNFTWTPAAGGDYTLKVTVDPDNAIPELDLGNNELTKAVSVCEVACTTFDIGWNMVSFYVDPSQVGGNFAALLGEEISPLAVYWYKAGVYEAFPTDNVTAQPGKGYWVTAFAPELPISVKGYLIPTENFTLSLTKGWNLIGYPFRQAVLWKDCWVKDLENPGVPAKKIELASTAGWIDKYFFWYEAGYDLGQPNGSLLLPWHAQWVKSKINEAQLIIPFPD